MNKDSQIIVPNIYNAWRMLAGIKKAKGRYVNYYALRELNDIGNEDIEGLIWLLRQELQGRANEKA